jgi:hypothetical protein
VVFSSSSLAVRRLWYQPVSLVQRLGVALVEDERVADNCAEFTVVAAIEKDAMLEFNFDGRVYMRMAQRRSGREEKDHVLGGC